MIIPLNSDKYKSLFTRANKFLDLTGTSEIQNLNQYYAHMKDFWMKQTIDGDGNSVDDKRKYQFIMMPLDGAGEEDFEIDLNTRTIKVPAAFQKIGAVESDQMSEMFVFRCDRFFDQMDLSGTNIYVQWELPIKNEDGTPVRKATQITMIDLESVPGKIRFAWPLHNEITSSAGIVKFSVRFFNSRMDGEKMVLDYALNTLEAQVTVKPVLNKAEFPSAIDVNNLFEQAIRNSANAANGIQLPDLPKFEKPGLNISKAAFTDPNNFLKNISENGIDIVVAKLSNNKLEVRAQAYVQDNGTLTYTWYIKNGDRPQEITDGVSEVFELVDYKNDKTINFNYNETYYIKNGEEYQRYTELGFPQADEYLSVENMPDIYEKYSVLTLEYSEEEKKTVTGDYYVIAKNSIYIDEEQVLNTVAGSTKFRLPAPEDIVFDENNLYSIIKEDNKEVVKVKYTEPQFTDQKDITWKYRTNTGNDYVSTETPITFINQESNIGYYLPVIRQVLNGTEKLSSPTTEYVKYPNADQLPTPQVEIQVPSLTSETGWGSSSDNQVQYFDGLKLYANVIIEDPNGENASTDENLFKNLTYQWQHQKDSDWINIVNSGENQAILEIQDMGNILARSYKCIVKNEINKNAKTGEDAIVVQLPENNEMI